MRRLLASIVFALATLADVSATQGEPLLRYSWDQCDPVIQNKDFVGPTIYRQTLSAVDLPAGLSGFSIVIALTGTYDAWAFEYGGCPGADRFNALPRVEGCNEIPGMELQWILQPPVTKGHVVIGVNGYIDPPLSADLPGRAGLATLLFDHELSGTECGGETLPICFHVTYATYGILDIPYFGYFSIVDDFISWNDPLNTLGCPAATPVRAQTWGGVKAIYR